MIDPFLFAKGIALGIAIAAPVGPIGVLTIRRTLIHGPRHGILTGVGAALADGVFGLIAAFGMVALSTWLISLKTGLHLIGGTVLLVLAIRTLLHAGHIERDPEKGRTEGGEIRAVASAFLLTLSNPMTILTFATAFTAVGLAETLSFASGLILVAGVFLGSASWFTALSLVVSATGGRLTPRTLLWIDRVAGVLLLVFSAYMFLALWLRW
ncbi:MULTISPECIES: LysE family translocator [Inquilinus]|jgi:threonine/homoserine/homoserine lactone efflux protein|uniref:Threonine/homoserine/homoserine lactone efflux protein n=1 Tax=Inquilinus ginsengisoli TaxID=363840 RepID=A0ABU1JJ63_9PROT|nr:LysE family translocator [Inquilinus ginsengisoli]MDR6287595.1 threonine/homoserine/homoserine lactone efflux protein [Inquilinus ginsengisoli]